MPVLTNQIGTFQFDDLEGNFDLPKQKIEVFRRPGVDGNFFRKRGERTERTRLKSVRYLADWDAAKSELSAYGGIVGGDSVTIISRSEEWGEFIILDVRQIEVRAIESAIGTITATPQVRLDCAWTVIFTQFPAP